MHEVTRLTRPLFLLFRPLPVRERRRFHGRSLRVQWDKQETCALTVKHTLTTKKKKGGSSDPSGFSVSVRRRRNLEDGNADGREERVKPRHVGNLHRRPDTSGGVLGRAMQIQEKPFLWVRRPGSSERRPSPRERDNWSVSYFRSH